MGTSLTKSRVMRENVAISVVRTGGKDRKCPNLATGTRGLENILLGVVCQRPDSGVHHVDHSIISPSVSDRRLRLKVD